MCVRVRLQVNQDVAEMSELSHEPILDRMANPMAFVHREVAVHFDVNVREILQARLPDPQRFDRANFGERFGHSSNFADKLFVRL